MVALPSGTAFIFGVFDGHGLAGEYASQKARDSIRDYLQQELPKLETGEHWTKQAGEST